MDGPPTSLLMCFDPIAAGTPDNTFSDSSSIAAIEYPGWTTSATAFFFLPRTGSNYRRTGLDSLPSTHRSSPRRTRGRFSRVSLAVPDIGDVRFFVALERGLALPGLTRLTGSPPLSPLLVTKTEV